MSSLHSHSESDSNDFICPNNFRAYQPPPSAPQDATVFWRRFHELATKKIGFIRGSFEDHVDFEDLDEPELDIGKDYFPIDANENKITDPEEAWSYFEDRILDVADKMSENSSKGEDECYDEWVDRARAHTKNKGKKVGKNIDVTEEANETGSEEENEGYDNWIDRAKARSKKKGKKANKIVDVAEEVDKSESEEQDEEYDEWIDRAMVHSKERGKKKKENTTCKACGKRQNCGH